MVPDYVVDTNVLTIASAPSESWVHPRIPLRELGLVFKVFKWVESLRNDSECRVVLDFPGKTIQREYKARGNMPRAETYGRRVIQDKIDRGLICVASLSYVKDGDRLVAELPDEITALVHDNDDWKMIAAALAADACIVNACDSDWSSPGETRALQLLGIRLVQILSDEERQFCRGPARRG